MKTIEEIIKELKRHISNNKPAEVMAVLNDAANRNLLEKAAKQELSSKQWGNGYTLLHVAVQNDMDEVVEKFVELGVNVNAKDDAGRCAVHIAANKQETFFTGDKKNYLSFEEKTEQAKNKTEQEMRDVIKKANKSKQEQKKIEIIKCLFTANGFLQNASTTAHGTALDIAINCEFYEIASILKEKGIDCSAKNLEKFKKYIDAPKVNIPVTAPINEASMPNQSVSRVVTTEKAANFGKDSQPELPDDSNKLKENAPKTKSPSVWPRFLAGVKKGEAKQRSNSLSNLWQKPPAENSISPGSPTVDRRAISLQQAVELRNGVFPLKSVAGKDCQEDSANMGDGNSTTEGRSCTKKLG